MIRDRVTAHIALGANLGDAVGALREARQALGQLPDSRLTASSSLYRTEPVEAQGPPFINAVVALETALCAPDLLEAMHAIEAAAGRHRPYRHAPRTLDLDLLWFGQGAIDSPRLTVPHPRWQERAFVLVPLAEIAPDRVEAHWLEAVANQGIERAGTF